MCPDGMSTSTTLLRRVVDWRDEPAWIDFIEWCRPLIAGRCRAASLRDYETEEITQRVLEKLAVRMRSFAYDPTGTFRGWLRKLADRQIIDERRARLRGGVAREVSWEDFGQIPARAEPEDEEGDHPLLGLGRRVVDEVRRRCRPNVWSVYWLVEIEGLPVREAGERHGMTYIAAYQARRRVRALLAEAGRRALQERDRGRPSGS